MMDEALSNQIIDSAKDTYLREFQNKYTGFLGVTCQDLLKHQLHCYGNITNADIESNNWQINEPIDLSLPIDN